VASTYIVESTPETVRSGYLDPAAKPVAVIASGDTIRYPKSVFPDDLRDRVGRWLRP
jgi:hypothetical protein